MRFSITVETLAEARALLDMLGGEISEATPDARAEVHVNAPPVPPMTPDTEAPTPPQATGKLDSRGMPWDSRIHAGNASKIGDGSWRKKRGVDPALVEQVEAEHRATLAAPEPEPETPPAPPAPEPESEPETPPAPPAPESEPETAPAPPAPEPESEPETAPAPPAPTAKAIPFPRLLAWMVEHDLLEHCKAVLAESFAVDNLNALGTKPELLSPLVALLLADESISAEAKAGLA